MVSSTTGCLNMTKPRPFPLTKGTSITSSASLKELHWWIDYIPHVSKRILHPVPSMIIQSDASKRGGVQCVMVIK